MNTCGENVETVDVELEIPAGAKLFSHVKPVGARTAEGLGVENSHGANRLNLFPTFPHASAVTAVYIYCLT
jgi:hypothetical protein